MRHRRDGDAHPVHIGRLRQHIQRHETTVAPAPNADARRVDIRQPADGARGSRLVLRLDDTQLLVDNLAPRFAARARATVVDARYDVPALREHLTPEVVLSTPVVGHGLRAGPTVDIEEDGITRRRVEIRRLDKCRVKLDAVTY